jgi:hypothetical protein
LNQGRLAEGGPLAIVCDEDATYRAELTEAANGLVLTPTWRRIVPAQWRSG